MAKRWRVRAIKHGQWHGAPFRPGDLTTMPDGVAQAYAAIQQVEILGPEEPAADPEPAAIAAKPVLERPGPPVETAAKPKREKRRR